MPRPWSKAGKLRHLVQLQRNIGTSQTASGQPVPAWQTYATTWASIEPVTGREIWLQAVVADASVTHVICLRWCPGRLVSPEHQVVFQRRVFGISFARNIEERGRELELLCVEHVQHASDNLGLTAGGGFLEVTRGDFLELV